MKKNVANTKCHVDKKVCFYFVLRFPIKWQQCVKLRKWNQHTSSFDKLISKHSLLPECELHNGYNVLCVQRGLHFVLIQKTGSGAIFHLPQLHLEQCWHIWGSFYDSTNCNCTEVPERYQLSGTFSWMNATSVQWWVSWYLNRFVFIMEMACWTSLIWWNSEALYAEQMHWLLCNSFICAKLFFKCLEHRLLKWLRIKREKGNCFWFPHDRVDLVCEG